MSNNKWQVIEFHVNGSKKTEQLILGRLVKVKKYFEGGELQLEGDFIDGKPEGLHVIYFQSGGIHMTTNYVSGIQEGEEVKYYESGEKLHVANCKNGKYEGKFTVYFKNGNIQSLISLVKGSRFGETIDYYESGSIRVVRDFSSHDVQEATGFYENGVIQSKATLINDELDGVFEGYDENGKLAIRQIYKQGELIGGELSEGPQSSIKSTSKDRTNNLEEVDSPQIESIKDAYMLCNLLIQATLESGGKPLFEEKMRHILELVDRDEWNNSPLEPSSRETSYQDAIKKIRLKYEEDIDSYDTEKLKKDFDLDHEIDLSYYNRVVFIRTWDNFSNNEFDPKSKYDWQDEHIEIYMGDWVYEHGVSKILNEKEKIDVRKDFANRILAFSIIYKLFYERLKKIRDLNKDYGLSGNLDEILEELICGQAHASYYAACSFTMKVFQQAGISDVLDFIKSYCIDVFDMSGTTMGYELLIDTLINSGAQLITEQTNKSKQQKEIQHFLKALPKKYYYKGLNHLAYTFIDNSEPSMAINLLSMELDDKNVEHATYFDTAAVAFLAINDLDNALRNADISIQLDQSNKSIHEHYFNRARIKIAMQNIESAKDDLNKAIDLKSDYNEAKEFLKSITNK